MHVIDQTFNELIGLPCWQVEWERQLGLKLSFGEPSLYIREPREVQADSSRVRRAFAYRKVTVKGQWWLWALCSDWSLSLSDMPSPVGPTTSTRQKREALGFLNGQKLLRATVDPSTSATDMTFDLGAVLRLFDSVCDEGDMYSLYKPDGNVLSIRTNGTFSHEQADHDHQWRSMQR